jgi:phenylpyruvate tautomerase PptA (4-oxalocrotonate tautomerase family)
MSLPDGKFGWSTKIVGSREPTARGSLDRPEKLLRHVGMPLLRLEVSIPVSDSKRDAILRDCSKLLSEVTGKPETYVMVTLLRADALLGGKGGPIAFGDVRAVGGLDGKTNRALAAGLSAIVERQLGVPPGRMYWNFTDVAASSWGMGADTLG